ncbi:uncharacterized protein EDB91DRAFT_1052476 [Suillus paluster]|uniref:uncharacterized protein n=1 Tax=Suillus paluster TaxID=48578 RepID=UPI001B879C89|nr:uncharacterized protein EDB91DRAFT_1052476 [Suillus paluster]KAG1741477.1 hypothetical protein EDB91DRAFT_1052476 [Suillus paluster]
MGYDTLPVLLLPVYTRVQGLLRPTSTTSSPIAVQEDEQQHILEFITSSWSDNAHMSLCISGTPGTGKTTLVNSVLCLLEASEGMSNRRVISINCMALTGVNALWDHLCEELSHTSTSKNGAKPCKAKGNSNNKWCVLSLLLISLSDLGTSILVLDELDHIVSSNQTLSSIFSLSQHLPSTLCIIGIANTHTLTSSLAQLSICEASSALTLHFGMYSSQQLLQVLQARLSPLYDTLECPQATEQVKKFLPTSTLTLLMKKIASQTGDVRALLFEVLWGTIDLAVTGSKVQDADTNPLATPPLIVKPDHILAALKVYLPFTGSGCSSTSLMPSSASSETASKVCNLGLQARLALLCMLLASKRMEATLLLSLSATSMPTKSPVKRTSSASANHFASVGSVQLCTEGTKLWPAIFWWWEKKCFADVLFLKELLGLMSHSSTVTIPMHILCIWVQVALSIPMGLPMLMP